MTMDPEGRVYLLDGVQGQILRDDRKGQFPGSGPNLSGYRRFTPVAHDGVFFLRVNSSLIMELQRRDPATWAVLSRTPLSDPKSELRVVSV